MPNQPDPANRVLSVRISRELYAKLRRAAEAVGMGFNEFVRTVLVSRTDHVELSRADYERILREKEEFLKRRKK